MQKKIHLNLLPAEAANESIIKEQIAAECGVSADAVSGYYIENNRWTQEAANRKYSL